MTKDVEKIYIMGIKNVNVKCNKNELYHFLLNYWQTDNNYNNSQNYENDV